MPPPAGILDTGESDMNASAKTPEIQVPLDEWAENLLDRALSKHMENCPLAGRVRILEIRFAALVGYMVGSGVVGGLASAAIMKIFNA